MKYKTGTKKFHQLFHLKFRQFDLNQALLDEFELLDGGYLFLRYSRMHDRKYRYPIRTRAVAQFDQFKKEKMERFVNFYNRLKTTLTDYKRALGGKCCPCTETKLLFYCRKLRQIDIMDQWVMSDAKCYLEKLFNGGYTFDKGEYNCTWCGCSSLGEEKNWLCDDCKSNKYFEKNVDKLERMLGHGQQINLPFGTHHAITVDLCPKNLFGFFRYKYIYRLEQNQNYRLNWLYKIEKVLKNSPVHW